VLVLEPKYFLPCHSYQVSSRYFQIVVNDLSQNVKIGISWDGWLSVWTRGFALYAIRDHIV